MNILILGNDGYIGYPLTVHLLERGHAVLGIDNHSRRIRVADLGSSSLTPINSPITRKVFLQKNYERFTNQLEISLGIDNAIYLKNIVESFKPDAIIHLAEQPSAAWSMRDVNSAVTTQYENVVSTLQLLWVMKAICPDAHLIKLGSMGEYGTPNCDIPEGRIPEFCNDYSTPEVGVLWKCPMNGLLFPRTAGSFYHLSKVHDTHNIEFACRNWHLHSTDIMQGVVYGLLPKMDQVMTRFDYDECFGTVINRFCVQAVAGHPLTVYGDGTQTRGFIHLVDSINCITIALDNPPKIGEYRTLNQFSETYSINQLAEIVCKEAKWFGLDPIINPIPNPRLENEDHYYKPIHQGLYDLGFKPEVTIYDGIRSIIEQILPFKHRIIEKVIIPEIDWRRLYDTN